MVIGNGMIAKYFSSFSNCNEVTIFASGVSNSKETCPEPYIREQKLVEQTLQQMPDCLFVYFSTASITDPAEQHSMYVQHKLRIEQLIARRASKYIVIRASNVVGGPGNPNTILNFFVNRIRQGDSFRLWQNAIRNLLDIDDLYKTVVAYINTPDAWNQIYLVVHPHSLSPLAMVKAIEAYTGQRAIYEILSQNAPDNGVQSGTEANEQQAILYTIQLLHKYY
ncbi:NAD-dependent epimerase/dehydratase family protein [Spirosoma luteum]|uniref:NAD-dependent epimerase/dehydratase family protein n=1 Tax=Spirosoma luteum TaxID=431553 RepID=UPI000367D69E|nr:NAD-dependent epimerase/dehydratase family protein [Spirosoma luteum]